MQFMYRHDAFIRLVDQYDSASLCPFQHTLPIADEEVEERCIDQGVAFEAEAGVIDSAAERGGSDHRKGGIRTVDDYGIALLMVFERKRPGTVRLDDRHVVSCNKYVQDLTAWGDQLLRIHQGPLRIQDALCGGGFMGECIRLLHEHMVADDASPLGKKKTGKHLCQFHGVNDSTVQTGFTGSNQSKKLVSKFVLQLRKLVLSCQ